MVKKYWSEKKKVDPKKVYCVSVMPCIAKKNEMLRD